MKSTVGSLCLLLPLLVGFATGELLLSHQTAVKEENDYLSVMCKDSLGGKTMWRGPKNRALGEKTVPIFRSTMYGGHLIFNQVRKEEAGIYICKKDKELAEFELIVSEPPYIESEPENTEISPDNSDNSYYSPNKIYNTYATFTNSYTTLPPTTTPAPFDFSDTPSNVSGKEGEDIMLRCEAKGATTEWLIDEEMPSNSNSKYQVLADGLLIKNATVSDSERQYVCKAIGIDTGSIKSKPISVSVIHPPRPRYARENIVYAYLGRKVNLTCEVDAVPPPKFKWFLRGANKLIIGKEVQGPSPTISVLMVVMRGPNDFGDYKCEAKNSEGTVDVIFTVLNGTQTNPPTLIEVLDATSTELFVKVVEPNATELENKTNMAPFGVRVEYRSEEDTMWNGQNFILADDKVYVVTNLMQNTTYQIRAATENPAGLSNYTDIIEYQTVSSAYSPSLYSYFTVSLIALLNGWFKGLI